MLHRAQDLIHAYEYSLQGKSETGSDLQDLHSWDKEALDKDPYIKEARDSRTFMQKAWHRIKRHVDSFTQKPFLKQYFAMSPITNQNFYKRNLIFSQFDNHFLPAFKELLVIGIKLDILSSVEADSILKKYMMKIVESLRAED